MTKKRLFLLAKFAVTAVLLWLVFRELDFAYIKSRLESMTFWPVGLAVLLLLFQSLLVSAWRWGKVLEVTDRSPPLTTLMSFSLVGLFFNQALPSTIGGDGMRMWLLHQTGRDVAVAFRSVIVDRFCGLLALLLVALAGAPAILTLFGSDHRGWITAMVIASGLAGSIGLVVLLRQRRWLETRLIRRNLAMVAFDVANVAAAWRGFLAILVASAVGHVALCASIALIARALHVELTLVDALIIMPTTFVLLVAPISIAGWGLREGIMVFGLGLVGIAAVDAVMVSVFFGLLLIVIGLPGGLVWLMIDTSRHGDKAASPDPDLGAQAASHQLLGGGTTK